MQNIKILFLQEFTKQLILNSTDFTKLKSKNKSLEKVEEKNKEKEELKKEIQEDIQKQEIQEEKIPKAEISEEEKQNKLLIFPKPNIDKQFRESQKKPLSKTGFNKIKMRLQRLFHKRPRMKNRQIKNQITRKSTLNPVSKPEFHPGFKPEFKPIDNFDLGKINLLIRDPTVTSIECPGPGKFLLVRKMNQVNVTKITLSEEEIKQVLEKFSQRSKIPVIKGVFRAVVGNLLITALESEYVGTRFIITKFSPKIGIK